MYKETMEMLQTLLLTLAVVACAHACPLNCNCGIYRTVKCSQITSLQKISAEIPKETNVLEITNGMFYTLSSTDFAEMPAQSLLQLKITDSQLTDIQPQALTQLKGLQVLDLSGNALRQISSPDIFSALYYLQNIDLSDNSLNDLPSGVFSAQSNLQELRIAGNKNIQNLRGPSFEGARTLKKFIASRCNIRTLESDFFSAISSVHTLDLSYNQIQSLPHSDSFRLLQKLRILTLQGNQITALTDSQFAGMDLDTLDLSKNFISVMNPNAFMYLSGVQTLDLSYNRIHSLPGYVFQPIASEVYNLKLNDNHALMKLPVEIFSGMRKMNSLNLSSCAIEQLMDEHFGQDFNVRQVDLSNNWIKYLPQTFMDKVNFMQHLKIANNPWHCDCLIRPLYNWLQFPQASTILYCTEKPFMGFSAQCPAPVCSSPQNLENRDISRLMPNDIDCENTGRSSAAPVSIIVGVLAGLVVMAIIIVIIACCLYRRHKRGDPLLCYEPAETEHKEKKNKRREHKTPERIKKYKKEPKGGRGDRDYYREKKENRKIDPESSSLNESDKSFVVRNFFHSMMPDPDGVSEGTHSQSMARKDSIESLSQSGYGYNSRPGSRHSSQYSLNAGYKIESAV